MLYFSPRLYPGRVSKLLSASAGLVTLLGILSTSAHAQRSRGGEEPESQPAFSEFKGVKIGMTADEARKKLGSPRDKGSDQDFYVFEDTKAVQVYYDKSGNVIAISVDFMSGATGIPSAKEVLGTEAETKPDGALYKMVRYPKAGYWVSYSRTAGTSPTTTVTMQKIDR